MNTSEREQLDWLAFLYVADELSPAERESFELQLADDQTAREALAGAVELSQVVAAAESQVEHFSVPLPAAANARWSMRHSLAMMALGAAACLALVVVAQQINPHVSTHDPVASVDSPADVSPDDSLAAQCERDERTRELAALWSLTHDQLHAAHSEVICWTDELGSESEDPDLDSGLTDFLAVDSADENTAPLAAPAWMLAAVSGMNKTEDPDNPEMGMGMPEMEIMNEVKEP